MPFRSFVLFSFLLLQLLLAKLAPYFKGFNSERLSDQAFMAFHLRELMKPSALKIAVVLLNCFRNSLQTLEIKQSRPFLV